MKMNKEEANRLAELLMFHLSEEENNDILSEFENIEANISNIEKIEGIKDIEPMTHALDDFEAELREDIPADSIDINDALRNCDSVDVREVSVPKVVSGE